MVEEGSVLSQSGRRVPVSPGTICLHGDTPGAVQLATALRRAFALPGMRVLQFGFDGDPANLHLPHAHSADCVVYTGTHDNDTVAGWWASASDHERHFARGYFAFYISGPWQIGEFKRRLPPELQGAWMTAPLPGPHGPGGAQAALADSLPGPGIVNAVVPCLDRILTEDLVGLQS